MRLVQHRQPPCERNRANRRLPCQTGAMANEDLRWRQRLESLQRALGQLKAALAAHLTGANEALRARVRGLAVALTAAAERCAALEGLREMGYGYAEIGSAGPVDFYVKTVGAIPIPNSEPGVYADNIDLKNPF